MIFKQRNITSINELTTCLIICRVMKVMYIGSLLAIGLYCAQDLIPAMSLNLAIVVWCTAFLSLTIVNMYSHHFYLQNTAIARIHDEFNRGSLQLSIWELYKSEACSVIENYSNK